MTDKNCAILGYINIYWKRCRTNCSRM